MEGSREYAPEPPSVEGELAESREALRLALERSQGEKTAEVVEAIVLFQDALEIAANCSEPRAEQALWFTYELAKAWIELDFPGDRVQNALEDLELAVTSDPNEKYKLKFQELVSRLNSGQT